jgi:MobA/MobL family
MAQYHFAARIIQRSKGQSAVASAAYRAGELLNDDRIGKSFDYRRHLGVLHSEILAPYNAPDWMRDRAQLWNAVEKTEKRKDSQLARSIDIALPHELNLDLNLDLNLELLRSFVQEQWVDRGMIADIAIHLPGRTGDIRNVHAHIALTTREITGSGFGPKAREWNGKQALQDWREAWADHANRILEREGFEERIDHRSLLDQGIDREPTTHIGPAGKEMDQRGVTSDRVQQNRDIKTANDNMALLKTELAESENRVAELRRQQAAERMEQIQKTVRAADAVWEKAEQRPPPAPEPPAAPVTQPEPTTPSPRPREPSRYADLDDQQKRAAELQAPAKQPEPAPTQRSRGPSHYADLINKQNYAERAKEEERKQEAERDPEKEKERERKRERER